MKVILIAAISILYTLIEYLVLFEMLNYQKYIKTRLIRPGLIEANIRLAAYPGAAHHWREQVGGRNIRKWGRLYIDPDPKSVKRRRREVLSYNQDHRKSHPNFDLDEAPGAMFYSEKDHLAHVELLCAKSNRALGRDLYFALRAVVRAERKNSIDGLNKAIKDTEKSIRYKSGTIKEMRVPKETRQRHKEELQELKDKLPLLEKQLEKTQSSDTSLRTLMGWWEVCFRFDSRPLL